MSKNTEAVETAKGKQLSTTVSADFHEALIDFGWKNRLRPNELVRAALEEYAAAHNIQISGVAPTA